MSEQTSNPTSGQNVPKSKFRRKSRQEQTTASKLRMERRGEKLDAAREKLAKQKLPKKPGAVKRLVHTAGHGVHGFVHGKLYEVEHENVGTEGAHRSELAAESVYRFGRRKLRKAIREHPAKAVERAESKHIKATADYYYRKTVEEHPEMQEGGAVSRYLQKQKIKRQYAKQAREAARQTAKAAEGTASVTGKLAEKVSAYIKEHPGGLLLLVAAYLPPMLLGWTIPSGAAYAACGLFAFCGAWGACVLVRFPSFRQVYRRIFTPDNLALLTGDTDPAAKETQAQYRSKLTLDSGPESRKTGCVRFNELFMRRNRRLLMRPARRTAVIAAVVLAAGCAACLVSPAAAAAVNGLVVQALPGMLLLMYFINRGNTVTRALFFNCDRSMLCYRFYRQPRVILGIFTARLKSLTAINLLPTTVIALGLPLLLLCSGGTDTPLDYAVLALSILAMSVFFSVHYLVLYYLLQPYTVGLENTSYVYRIITGLTYVVCYLISANVRGSTAFGVGVVLFAAVYVAAALLLAYHLAPRTFKLRT